MAPAISTHPAGQTVALGHSATFLVEATGSAPLTYQWQLGGSPVGTNAASYTSSSSLVPGSYPVTVTVWNAYGTVTSNTATLTVLGTPAVSLAPESGSLRQGAAGSVTFAVTAANLGDGITGYLAWYTSSAGTTPALAPTGVTGAVADTAGQASLVTVSADPSAVAGTYYFTVTFGATTSAVTALSVDPETLVYQDTAAVNVTTTDALVAAGHTLTVDATALTGAHTLTWNGAAETDGAFNLLAGASAATLTGGTGNDTFDFTASGVVFSSLDRVTGGGGSNLLKLGLVSGTDALDQATDIQKITFENGGPVNLVTTDALVAAGKILTIDASALAGSNTFTWNSSAETDGSCVITAGSSDATITVGAGNNVINTGSGSSTITLGTHLGGNTIRLNDLTAGMAIISGFTPLGPNRDVLRVSSTGGLTFIDALGSQVGAGSSTSTLYVAASGHLSAGAYGNFNLIIMGDAAYTTGALVAALESGGVDELTFTNGAGGNATLLVLYSDNTDGHLVGINPGPTSVTAGQAVTHMTSTDLATLQGITVVGLGAFPSAEIRFF